MNNTSLPKSNYKVITQNTPSNRNYNVITTRQKSKCKHIVITLLTLCYSIVNTNTALAALELKSPITQASFIYGRTTENEQVFLNDREIHQTPAGEFVIALPQDTDDDLILTTKSNGITKIWSVPIEKRTWKEEVVNGLPPKKVSPDKAAQKQIANDSAALKKARSITKYTVLPRCFSRPVDKKARISSQFGSRRILNGQKTAGHSGTDYALPAGTPVYAPADGVVNLTHPDMFFSGKTILLDHGYGIYSSYSHLSRIDVKQGDFIKRGEKIGEIGTTGRSTGPHLHFTMTWFGIRVDPEFMLTYYACRE